MAGTMMGVIIPISKYGVCALCGTKSHVYPKVHNAPAQVEPLISVVGNVTKTVISSPPPEVVALGVTEDKVVSSASDSRVCQSKRLISSNLTRGNLGFLTSKVSLIQKLWLISGSMRSLFTRPHRTQKIRPPGLMSATPYRPRDQP